jgi:hypothetical protein
MEVNGEVAVGVVDHTAGREDGGVEAGLLLELPTGGPFGGLSALDLATGELPEPAQEAAERPRLHEPSAAPRQSHHSAPMVGTGARRTPDGEDAGVRELLSGPAERGHRAGAALRRDRTTDGLAELHDRLVEPAGAIEGEELAQPLLEPEPGGRGTDVRPLEGPPGRHPDPVRLESDDGAAERERGHRPGDVRADPRKGLQIRDLLGEPPRVVPDDLPRRLMQVARPGVVPRPFPDLQDRRELRVREGRDVRERRDEPFVERDRLRHARLLEDHLGDPHVVRVGVPTPRERPPVVPEPREELSRQLRVRSPGAGSRRTRHGASARAISLKAPSRSKAPDD